MAALPMFPLGSVLLPGELLPLQVFEPRYRAMVVDILADDANPPEFGVTLIERGHEVGGGDQRTDVGTIARIVGIDVLDGGRYALVALGIRRIRVRRWLPDDPYPVADVDDWADESDGHQDLERAVAATRARVEAMRRLAGRDDELPELDGDPVAATYHLVSVSPLGAADRHRLLAASSPGVRLELLADALDDVEAVLRFQRG